MNVKKTGFRSDINNLSRLNFTMPLEFNFTSSPGTVSAYLTAWEFLIATMGIIFLPYLTEKICLLLWRKKINVPSEKNLINRVRYFVWITSVIIAVSFTAGITVMEYNLQVDSRISNERVNTSEYIEMIGNRRSIKKIRKRTFKIKESSIKSSRALDCPYGIECLPIGNRYLSADKSRIINPLPTCRNSSNLENWNMKTEYIFSLNNFSYWYTITLKRRINEELILTDFDFTSILLFPDFVNEISRKKINCASDNYLLVSPFESRTAIYRVGSLTVSDLPLSNLIFNEVCQKKDRIDSSHYPSIMNCSKETFISRKKGTGIWNTTTFQISKGCIEKVAERITNMKFSSRFPCIGTTFYKSEENVTACFNSSITVDSFIIPRPLLNSFATTGSIILPNTVTISSSQCSQDHNEIKERAMEQTAEAYYSDNVMNRFQGMSLQKIYHSFLIDTSRYDVSLDALNDTYSKKYVQFRGEEDKTIVEVGAIFFMTAFISAFCACIVILNFTILCFVPECRRIVHYSKKSIEEMIGELMTKEGIVIKEIENTDVETYWEEEEE